MSHNGISDSQANAGRRSVYADPEDSRNIAHLVRWFIVHFEADIPSALHAAGPWNGPQEYDKRTTPWTPLWPQEQTGGSALGAPRLADAFRSYIEDGADRSEFAQYDHENDRVPHYRTPMRANLAAFRIAHPMLARMLFQLGYCDGGDWRGAARRRGMTSGDAEVLYGAALRTLWEGWRDEPPARVLRDVA